LKQQETLGFPNQVLQADACPAAEATSKY